MGLDPAGAFAILKFTPQYSTSVSTTVSLRVITTSAANFQLYAGSGQPNPGSPASVCVAATNVTASSLPNNATVYYTTSLLLNRTACPLQSDAYFVMLYTTAVNAVLAPPGPVPCSLQFEVRSQ